ncbi:MAG: glycosyltransferase family 1 protein, partial [Nakamurella sp.]
SPPTGARADWPACPMWCALGVPVLSVIVEQCLAPVPGGTGRYAGEIAEALAAEPAPGWTVRTVTAWHRDLGPARLPGVPGPTRLPAGSRALAELWRRGWPPTVRGTRVHATTPLAPGRRSGLVVTVHDAVPWTHPETLTPRGVSWHRTMIARAADRAEWIVVPSLAVADDLAGIFPAAADRLRVIAHGVTALIPTPDAERRRHAFGLPRDYLLSVATLEPRKGLDVLIEAMASSALPDTHLAVVGQPGWGGLDLSAAAGAAGLPPERLHVLGRLDDVDLAAVLAGATALVAPSRSEGFGLPVLEAMAAGIPVVCSDVPALVELAGGVGVIVPRENPAALADALAALIGDPAAVAELAAGGRRRAADFSWAAAAAAVWALHTGRSTAQPARAVTGSATARPSSAGSC